MTTLPLLVAVIIFAAVAILAYVIANMFGEDRRMVAERLQRHGGDARVTAAIQASSAGSAALLLDKEYSSVEALNQVLKRSGWAERVAADLARAAVPMRVGEYLFLRWLAAIWLYGLASYLFHLSVVVCVVLAIVGFFLPRFYVRQKENARIKKFNDQLIDALSMMANALKSGSSFLQAMDLVAHEQPVPICQEFARVVAEANVGASVEASLLAMGERVRSYDLYLITTAMLVQREVGGNLAEVLETIAHTIRERQRILNQVRVETAETRLSGYIIAVLPVFLLVVVSVINPMYAQSLLTGFGQIVLVGAAIWEIIGFLVIRRIVNIEV